MRCQLCGPFTAASLCAEKAKTTNEQTKRKAGKRRSVRAIKYKNKRPNVYTEQHSHFVSLFKMQNVFHTERKVDLNCDRSASAVFDRNNLKLPKYATI